MKQQKANWNPRRDRDEGRKGGTGSPGGGRGREGCSRAEELTLKEAEKGRERLGQRANGELNWRGGGTEGGDQSPPPGPSPRAPESAKHTEPRHSHAAPGTRAGAGGRAGPSGHHAPRPPGARGLLGDSGIPEARKAAAARVRGRAAESFALRVPVTLKLVPGLGVAKRRGSGRRAPTLAAHVPARGRGGGALSRERGERAAVPHGAASTPCLRPLSASLVLSVHLPLVCSKP
uniref:Uncharacterized protein n=1 Tax=Rangifer tarandus platyrhynchus TaxID=3082113 RepID=A0ACB0E9D6_RANTA|nr:unnamed protein product [Rangifer tarandus platyrhynchus]